MLEIVQRLFTAYYLKTDSFTECMNQMLKTYFCMFIDYAQNDWCDLLSSAKIAINNRDVTFTKVSLFFLQHDYHIDSLNLHMKLSDNVVWNSLIQQAHVIVQKLKNTQKWTQSAITAAQQIMKKVINCCWQQASSFKVKDKVWLSLKNIHTDWSAKKLNAKQAKFTVTEIVGSHFYKLNMLSEIHNVFHSKLLWLALYDFLNS